METEKAVTETLQPKDTMNWIIDPAGSVTEFVSVMVAALTPSDTAPTAPQYELPDVIPDERLSDDVSIVVVLSGKKA